MDYCTWCQVRCRASDQAGHLRPQHAHGVSEGGQRVTEGRHGRGKRVSAQAEAQRRASAVVIQDRYPDNPLAGLRSGRRLQVGRQLPLPFIPPVLEPDFDLSLREMQRGRQAGSLRAAQVTLHVERGLELEHLAAAEHCPSLLLPPGTQLGGRVLLRACVRAVLRVLAVVRQLVVARLPVGLVAAVCDWLGPARGAPVADGPEAVAVVWDRSGT